MEKAYKTKFIAIFVLVGCIALSILYLVMTNFFGQRKDVAVAEPTPTAQVTAPPTPFPTYEPTPTPVIIDIDTTESIQKLVNVNRTLSETYVPSDLVQPNVSSNGSQLIRTEAATALENMFNAASEAGYPLKLLSGYRSYTDQVSLWWTYQDTYGYAYTNRMDSHPGYSEHQLGLAVDVGYNGGYCQLRNCFGISAAGMWLQEHAHEYGFILRYPDGKEGVTGIMYSPWHYRYVGIDEATGMHNASMTMEEYYAQPIQ